MGARELVCGAVGGAAGAGAARPRAPPAVPARLPRAQLDRRRALEAVLGALLLPPGLAAAARAAPPPAAPPAPPAAGADDDDEGSFYARWPYRAVGDILPYVRAAAPRGDAAAVLAAIDAFAGRYPMFRSGPEKGALVEAEVRAAAPVLALELGAFVGYGAVRIARALPPGGRLVTLEADPETAAVARGVVAWAGLADRVRVLEGAAAATLPALRAELEAEARLHPGAGGGAGGPGGPSAAAETASAPPWRAGFVFLDHCKACYAPDLAAMEALGLVGAGSVVAADNVLFPGAPGYLERVGLAAEARALGWRAGAARTSGEVFFGAEGAPGGAPAAAAAASPGADAASACAWRGRLVPAAYEVEERFRVDWAPQRDAVAVSVCLGPAPG
jgi:catechol O-methyltransferase